MTNLAKWPNELAAAAALLSKAAGFAETLQRSRWDFAVEINELIALGLSRADLRWLVCHGLLDHAVELIESSDDRKFQRRGKLTFADGTCFVLTAQGHSASSNVDMADEPHPPAMPCKNNVTLATTLKPQWNPNNGRLSFGYLLVKEYRVPAPNQHLILSVFQEENWPERIDDPLPPVRDIKPKRRLHETIASLNRRCRNRVLRFCGDGLGRGVRWLSTMEPASRAMLQHHQIPIE
jgi:hypothetical protein